jgi:hypothetical protein
MRWTSNILPRAPWWTKVILTLIALSWIFTTNGTTAAE